MGKTIIILLASVFLQGTLAESTPVRILPLGDSITHGYWSGISTDYNSYRKELKHLLETNGYAVDFVGSLTDGDFADNQHEGHDGWFADHETDTRRMVGHAANWVIASSADIVLLHIGTNDVNGGNESSDEVSAILDEIFSTNNQATVVLALIINGSTNYHKRTQTSVYNTNLNTMAQARIANGDDIIVVDMENEAGLNYASTDMNDTLHPSQAGYDKMATNWYPAIALTIDRRTPPPCIESLVFSGDLLVLSINNLSTGRQASIEQTGSIIFPAWSNAATFMPSTTHTNWSLSEKRTEAYYRVVIP